MLLDQCKFVTDVSNDDDGSLEFFASETIGLGNSCTIGTSFILVNYLVSFMISLYFWAFFIIALFGKIENT